MATSRSDPSTSSRGGSGIAHPLLARRLLCRDHHVYFEIHGPEAGPAVVLLHHGLGSVRAWRSQIPALAAAGFQVMAYDRWGYGASDSRPSLDLPGFGADILDLEDLLEAAGMARVALIGHSDGGTMALYFASRWPERVWALVTVAAHIYVEPAMVPRMISIGQTYGGDRELREKLEGAHGEMTDQVFRNWYEGWFNPRHLDWDMRPLLGKIACPALVIQGEEDEDASSQHARDLASGLASASLWLVPGARHMVPQEAPEEFNHRVIGFLKAAFRGEARSVDHGRVLRR